MNILTFLLSLAGALAWIPHIASFMKPCKINGKIISFYSNYGDFAGREGLSLFLFKIVVKANNKDFNLKDINIKLKYKNSGWISTSAQNPREVVFTFDEGQKKLKLNEKDLLNNNVLLPKDSAIGSYIFTTVNNMQNDKVEEIELIFIPFKGKTKTVRLNITEAEENFKLAFDDNIWQTIN